MDRKNINRGDYTSKTWGIGIVKYCKNKFNKNKNELYHVIASLLPIIPLFHHSIIPDAKQENLHQLPPVNSMNCRISEAFTNDPS
jgi:hypothetical protein